MQRYDKHASLPGIESSILPLSRFPNNLTEIYTIFGICIIILGPGIRLSAQTGSTDPTVWSEHALKSSRL